MSFFTQGSFDTPVLPAVSLLQNIYDAEATQIGDRVYLNLPNYPNIPRMSSRIPIKLKGRLQRSKPSRAPMSVIIQKARSRGFVSRTAAMRVRHHSETKTVDTAATLNFDTDSAVANCMKLVNTIATGSASTQRIGKRVNLKAIAIRGQIYVGSATTIQRIALLLVYIRNPNQAATLPAVAEILATQSSLSLTNRDGASKFKIIRRWDFKMSGNQTTPATGLEIIAFDKFVSLKGLPSEWTNASTAGTIGEFEKGALILLSVGAAANGATTTPIANLNNRIYYVDT